MNAMKIFSFATAAQAWEYWRALKRMSLVGASPIVVDAAHIVAAKARSDFERELAERLAQAHHGSPWALMLVVAMLGLLAGCGNYTRYDFAFEGPDADYAAAQQAADEWNGCQSVHVTVTRGPDPSKQAIRFQGDEFSDSVYGAAECGRTQVDGSIDYTRCGDTIPVASILAHEMGHSMGLDHAGTGVMRVHRHSGDATVNGDDCHLLDVRP